MRILLIRNDVLGDAVVTSTLIEVLANSIQHAQIDILCNKYTEAVYRYNPFLKHIFVIDHRQNSRELAADFPKIRQDILMHGAYHAIFILNPCIRNYRYAARIPAKLIIARKLITKSSYARIWMLVHKLAYLSWHFISGVDKNSHEVEHLYNLAQHGLKLLHQTAVFPLPKTCSFYLQSSAPSSRRGIIINASGKMGEQRYLNDSMLYGLLKVLSSAGPLPLALIAAPSDQLRVERLIAALGSVGNSPLLIVENDIIRIAQIMATYAIFIGGDGGLSHVAAGCGLYCIVLFDKQLKRVWHPWTELHKSIQTSTRNIYDISLFTVLDAVNEFTEVIDVL